MYLFEIQMNFCLPDEGYSQGGFVLLIKIRPLDQFLNCLHDCSCIFCCVRACERTYTLIYKFSKNVLGFAVINGIVLFPLQTTDLGPNACDCYCKEKWTETVWVCCSCQVADGGCFPSTATVTSKSGDLIKMADLGVGEPIMTGQQPWFNLYLPQSANYSHCFRFSLVYTTTLYVMINMKLLIDAGF